MGGVCEGPADSLRVSSHPQRRFFLFLFPSSSFSFSRENNIQIMSSADPKLHPPPTTSPKKWIVFSQVLWTSTKKFYNEAQIKCYLQTGCVAQKHVFSLKEVTQFGRDTCWKQIILLTEPTDRDRYQISDITTVHVCTADVRRSSTTDRRHQMQRDASPSPQGRRGQRTEDSVAETFAAVEARRCGLDSPPSPSPRLCI